MLVIVRCQDMEVVRSELAVLKSGVISSTVHGVIGKVGSKLKVDWWAEGFAEVDDRGYWQVREVLRAEYDDFALSYEEGDRVFGLRRVVAGLDAGGHRACRRCQVFDERARGGIGQSWISVFGMFVVLEWFGQWLGLERVGVIISSG